MDVVLRTPHGEGEISLVVDAANVTLGDVIERVVGHPAPPVVYVDGRAVAAQTIVAEAGLVVGSVIDTDDAAFRSTFDAPVILSQLAGHGCGTIAPLLQGDYRIGPGRRIHANELAMAPVDQAVMELRVDDDGSVMVRDQQGVRLIGGEATRRDRFVAWNDEPLAIEGRIFELRRPANEQHADPPSRRTNPDGSITFHRPATSGTENDAAALTPSEALTMARTHSPLLWQKRIPESGDLTIPLGLQVTDSDDSRDDHRGDRQALRRAMFGAASEVVNGSAGADERLRTILADLGVGRGVAVVGGADFTRSTAYGLVVLAATLYGPADLDVVVATTPERANGWEWVKWLPHARLDGRPDIMVDEPQLRSWLRRRRRRWSAPHAPRRTLMVVDDENAWHERDSPLREIVADDSAPISFVVLSTHLHDVPTLCETVVSERSHGTAHVDLRQRRRRYDDVYAFIVTADFASEIARRLACLDDAAIAPAPTPHAVEPFSINDLHGVSAEPRAAIARRWTAGTDDDADAGQTAGLVLRFGHSPAGVAAIDLAVDGPHLLALCPDDDEEGHGAVDAALLGACLDHSPDELEIVVLSAGPTPPLLARLPHVSSTTPHLDAPRLRRVTRSLLAEQQRRRAMLDHLGAIDFASLPPDQHGLQLPRLVVVVDSLDQADRVDFQAVAPLVEIPGDVGIHVIVRCGSTAPADEPLLGHFGVTIDASGGPPAFLGHPGPGIASTSRATIRAGRLPPVEFDPPDATRSVDDRPGHDRDEITIEAGAIHIEPFVVARDPTPMEKRLVRDVPDELAPALLDPGVLDILDALQIEASTRPRVGHRPVTDELPTRIDLLRFLSAHPGDGVPFALADAPDRQRHETVWWLPGANSSIVAYGVARSKVSALIPSLAVGAATRLGSTDVRFHVVAPDTAALAPLGRLPHTASLVAARATSQMADLVDELAAEVDRRLARVGPDVTAARVAATETSIVLMVDDVGGCRRHLEGRPRDLWTEIEHLLVRGQPVGVTAILIARRTEDVSARLAATIDSQLVFQLAANDSAQRFGLPVEEGRIPVAARARSAPDGTDLQLATISADLDRTITEQQLVDDDTAREDALR